MADDQKIQPSCAADEDKDLEGERKRERDFRDASTAPAKNQKAAHSSTEDETD
jgi:hypothetical protein